LESFDMALLLSACIIHMYIQTEYYNKVSTRN
jgi:hypothetical protein